MSIVKRRQNDRMPTETTAARFESLLAGFSRNRILVVGDLMLDEFIWGKVSRISPEAPVPVVNVASESYYPGGAANVARNIREFTASTMLLGRTGADRYGCQLLELLAASGIHTGGVIQDPAVSTIVKTRIIARNQQVVRVDREQRTPLSPEQTERAAEYVESVAADVDAVVVADYGKGFLTQPLADGLCRSVRRHGKILTVDPHPHTSLLWQNATAIKPNRLEAFLAAGMPASEPVVPVLSDRTLLEAGRRLFECWKPRDLLITLGENGMLLFRKDGEPHHIPTTAKTVFDVSGAGDTAIAILTLALASGAGAEEAADLANRASGIVVGKLGTAAVTAAELRDSIRNN
jgi:D-beta-D-heptose 7-phosphate kinase/D-beta-D-heptose 1-phosphate adenosyltransferase